MDETVWTPGLAPFQAPNADPCTWFAPAYQGRYDYALSGLLIFDEPATYHLALARRDPGTLGGWDYIWSRSYAEDYGYGDGEGYDVIGAGWMDAYQSDTNRILDNLGVFLMDDLGMKTSEFCR
jgi:hypothetical protein